MTPPDETWHCCETTFDSLTSVLSAAGSWSGENAARENRLIWTAPRPGARHRLGFGSELQPGKGLDSQMIGLTVGRQSSQHRMGEDTPSGLQQPKGFKDRKVDGLQLYGLLQQLLIRWALFHGWHLINVPPCVEVLQQEVEAAGEWQEAFWLCWWQWQKKEAPLSKHVLVGIYQGWKYIFSAHCNRVLFDVSSFYIKKH